MRKFLILSLLVLCMGAGASAKSLVLLLSDGTEVYYLLGGEADPVMKIVDGEVCVNADKYAFSGIQKFYISQTDDPSGIPGVEAGGAEMRDGVLYVRGKGAVRVFTADGRAVGAGVSADGGVTSVDMNALPQGVYVLSVNGKSMKFLKR